MGISSLGVGSSILTQDVLDQLRAADESAQITPIDLSLANENDKKDALALIDASMTNLIDSITEIKTQSLFDERSTTVSGTAVEVTAEANSDIQDFTLSVTNIATKQIEQSGAFTARTETIANAAGSVSFSVGAAAPITIDYDETTTLDDFKKLINDQAGDLVDATIVQINSGEFRLFISAANTGDAQNIAISDTSGNLKDTRLTTSFDASAVQTGINASFSFNGQAIERESNSVDDLIAGLDITLKEAGTSVVSVEQNRDNIIEKIDSFVEKYNSAITELGKMTKQSTDSAQRGIFSGESTIKNMKSTLQDLISTIGGGVGYMADYGFDLDVDGKMTIDKTVFNAALDENPANVEAFFSGGTYTNADTTTVELTGAFNELATVVEGYTKYNATLDLFEDSITQSISALEDRKESATSRLDTKYEILKKQYAAYDLIISQINSASSMFTQMADAQTAAQNS
ncbi:flagellar filament capping protein FliD [bacterium]|nr:flagellar filament capping protein FliD [bacterium]MBU1990592.1 flagellar filament capping protein FliD [bacterium]